MDKLSRYQKRLKYFNQGNLQKFGRYFTQNSLIFIKNQTWRRKFVLNYDHSEFRI